MTRTTTTTRADIDAIEAARRDALDEAIEALNELQHEYQADYNRAMESGNESLANAYIAQNFALNDAAWRIIQLRYRH